MSDVLDLTLAAQGVLELNAGGVQGQPGLPGYNFIWSTSTTNADPGSGKVKVNNATLASATSVYISETDALGRVLSALMATWDDSTNTIKGQITLTDPVTPANFAVFNVNGALTDNGTWVTLPVAFVSSGGTFTNLLALVVSFTAAGNLGATGANGVSPTRNRIINGNFRVNQRVYVSTTATAVGTYMHDRWKSNTANSAYTFTQGAPDTSITITAGTIVQIIENENVEGGTYRLSWAGAATLRWAQGATAAAALAALSGGFAASPISVTGVTAGNFIAVEAATGTLGTVLFEAGTVVTTFEREAFSVLLEKCMRYYEKSFNLATAPAQNAGLTGAFFSSQIVGASAVVNFWVPFKVKKRTTSTITIFNPSVANAQIRNTVQPSDFAGSGSAQINENGFVVGGTSAAASTAGQLCAVHWTAECDF